MTYKIQIDDLIRDANDDEVAQIEAERLAIATAKEQAEAKREAALSKLAALGLTADDLKALGL